MSSFIRLRRGVGARHCVCQPCAPPRRRRALLWGAQRGPCACYALPPTPLKPGEPKPRRCTHGKPVPEQQSHAGLTSASAHPILPWLCGPFSQLMAAQIHTLKLLLVAGANQTLPCYSDRLRAGLGTICRAGGTLRLSLNKAKRRVMPTASRPSLSPPHPSGCTKVSARSSSWRGES